MAYSTRTQVEGEFKSVAFSSTTEPTDTEINRFIEEADAEIDSIIGVKYSTPVTDATGIILLRRISIAIVAERVKEILAVKLGKKELEQQSVGELSATRARSMLDKIAQGKMKLGGAALASSHDGVKSYVSSNSVPHNFDMTKQQW